MLYNYFTMQKGQFKKIAPNYHNVQARDESM